MDVKFYRSSVERKFSSIINFDGSYHADLNGLADELDHELDADRRLELATEIQLIAIENAWDIILPVPLSYNFWQPWVRGYHGGEHVTMHVSKSLAAYI